MRAPALLLIVPLLIAPLASAADPQPPSPWSARAGYAYAAFDTSSSLALAGSAVPGASVKIEGKSLLLGDIDYEFADHWTARFALAVPPTLTVLADGTLTGFVPPLSGTLGKIKLAPAVLSATYTLGEFNAVKPYVGAGINYTRIMQTTDGDIASLRTKNAWGPVLQMGCDLVLDRNWYLFADARKLFLKTTATGTVPALGGPPVQAAVTLNPMLVSAGVGYRF
jgi:outer membrane protein